MRVHHLNCGSLCPHGRKLINGEGGLGERGEIVCHCLAIENGDGIVLVDTGFGIEDARNPRQLGPIFAAMGARPKAETTALRQLEELGFAAADVRQIVATHLDPDHSGGLPDFPQAEVHVLGAELDAALHPGCATARATRHALETRAALAAPRGRRRRLARLRERPHPPRPRGRDRAGPARRPHPRPHRGGVRTGDGWLLHCGDSYFHHGELQTPPHCPPGLRFFQNLNAADNRARKANQERLRELVARHGEELTLFCSHDPHELEREQAAGAAAPA